MAVTRWRKKPVEIEAVQWTGSMADVIELVGEGLPTFGEGYDGALAIETLEGRMRVDPNDYIIKGVRGEFYPCKPDIFLETYEEVVDE